MSLLSRLTEGAKAVSRELRKLPADAAKRLGLNDVPDRVRTRTRAVLRRKPRTQTYNFEPMRQNELTYTLFAGVNGAGKTSLYRILNKYEDMGVRVNIDEIVASEGNWKDNVLQVLASRRALRMIGDCIDKRQSFNQETTLPGSTIVRQIKRAKEAGYHVRLYFVGVENLQTAIKRVQRRVEQGGHGVDEELIRRRYEKLPETLHDVLPLVDSAFFYDNTVKFIQVAHVRKNVIVDCENDIPVWFWELIANARTLRNDANGHAV